ncbi:hypothetical protein COPG_00006 [Colwellia phage 9A]|uniref:Uncharacterized protein n=1 Tax=Colwellia phage 9A TaxID=765765 RepID=I3UM87_9CAUD|nr:hypothetical protein COPG_00006 [Colwellia phage 9A]AFK66602.1 hypothetical protein COPG_00006 [Colwellia phage 9A]
MNYFRLARKITESFDFNKPCLNKRVRLVKKLCIKAGIKPLTLGQKMQLVKLDQDLELLEIDKYFNRYKIIALNIKIQSFLK